MTGTVVVTGGAAGIGLAICSEFLARGFDVVAVDRNADGNGGIAQEKGRLVQITADVTDVDIADRCFTAAPSRLAVLVNSAFAEERAPLLRTTDAGWQRTFDVNLHAAVRLAKAYVVRLSGSPGVVINIASAHAYGARSEFGPYAASKAALIAFTRAAAVEWGPLGIRVNAVAPGFIAVERNRPSWEDQAVRNSLRRGNPLCRLGTPEDVARSVAFLASQEADFITGAVLPVDGGLLAQLPRTD